MTLAEVIVYFGYGHGGSNFVLVSVFRHALYTSHGDPLQAPTLPTCYAGLLPQVPSSRKANELAGR